MFSITLALFGLCKWKVILALIYTLDICTMYISKATLIMLSNEAFLGTLSHEALCTFVFVFYTTLHDSNDNESRIV